MLILQQILDNCISENGTNATFCKKLVEDITPTKHYNYNFDNENYFSKLFEGRTFEDLNLLDINSSITNDDVQSELMDIMSTLVEMSFIKEYKISFDQEYQSLSTLIQSPDNHKEELYDFFSSLPESFNSRVITYIS